MHVAPQLLPDRAEQPAAELLRLVHQEGQHHQHGEHHRQVLLPVPVVVFVVVPLILQRVEGLVLDVPPHGASNQALRWMTWRSVIHVKLLRHFPSATYSR